MTVIQCRSSCAGSTSACPIAALLHAGWSGSWTSLAKIIYTQRSFSCRSRFPDRSRVPCATRPNRLPWPRCLREVDGTVADCRPIAVPGYRIPEAAGDAELQPVGDHLEVRRRLGVCRLLLVTRAVPSASTLLMSPSQKAGEDIGILRESAL